MIIITGCAKKNSIKKQSEEEVLRTRVTEYWNYRTNLELDKCYAYEYPLLRKKINLVQYIKSFNTELIKWQDFSIKSIRIFDKEKAEVDLDITISVKMPMVKTFEDRSSITEKWVKLDGMWYHVSERFS